MVKLTTRKRRAKRKPVKKVQPQVVTDKGDEVVAVIQKPRRGPHGFSFPSGLAENIGFVGLNHTEIAGLFGVSRQTVEREFAKGNDSEFVTLYEKGISKMREGLRKQLLKRATKDNSDTALIFALKNYCGMRDKHEVDHGGKIEVFVTSGGEPLKEPKWLTRN